MTTRTTTQHDLTEALRSVVDGPVLTAGLPAYDRARTPYFEHWIGEPLAVVQPLDAADVAATIDVARSTGVELSVRGGGHSSHSTGDGLLLDLSRLDAVAIHPSGHQAWAGGGLTAGGLARALAPFGLAVGLGDIGSVGIGGLTLGGGIGYLSRRDGLTIDNLLAAEIVTADGEVRAIDEEHEPDLFWAIRGGGGNFGVVTRFRYRTVPIGQVYAGMLVFRATPQILPRIIALLGEADETVTAIVDVMPAPPLPGLPHTLRGNLVVTVRVCYSGDPGRGVEALAPLRAVATPVVDTVAPVPYAALFDVESPSKGTQVAGRTMFVDQVDDTTAAVVLEHLTQPGPMMRMAQFRVLGGAIARVPADATAYAHRSRPVMVTVVHDGTGDRTAALRWVDTLASELSPPTPNAYVNFIGPDDAHRVYAAYPGEVLPRLRRIKAAYDPTNLFRGNVNIRP